MGSSPASTIAITRSPITAIPNPQSPIPDVNDLFAQLDAEAIPNSAAAAIDQLPDLGGRGRAFVDDEVAVRRRDARPAGGGALQPGAIDQRARRPGNAVGHDIAPRLGILKDATGARRIERLRPLAKR